MNLLTIKNLAAEKSISVSTIRSYLKLGLPHYKPSRKIYIDPREFDEWFSRFKVKPDSSTPTNIDEIITEALSSLH